MEVVTTIKELQERLQSTERSRVGFVPTMGALHRGHLALVEQARKQNETVVVSIFVNPTQFNDKLDLQRYPRTPDEDIALLERVPADLVFLPSVDEIYPETDTRQFDFGHLDKVMEGATRPGHFNGVAQVVSRLFTIVDPARAYFGEKDFQQVAVVREMVRQLSFDIDIVACPTIREEDGLALSSRNTLLDAPHRQAAPLIYRSMRDGVKLVAEELRAGRNISPREVEKTVISLIESDPLLEVVYFQIVNAATLMPAERWDESEGIRGCAAVRAGEVRLIDNISFV